jgi:hypothetical protein
MTNGSSAVTIAAVLESAVNKMAAAFPDRSSFFSLFMRTFSVFVRASLTVAGRMIFRLGDSRRELT